jgi:6-phosphogluconolactonase
LTTFFFTAGAVTGSVETYRLDRAAASIVPVASVSAGGKVSTLAVGAAQLRLYAADRGRPGIVTFAIDPHDGTLTELGRVPTASELVYLLLSRDGRTLYGASYRDGTVCAQPVGGDGVIGPAPRPPLSLGADARCHAVAEAPDGTLWVSALGHDLLYRIGLDPGTGTLAEVAAPVRVPAGTGPRHTALDAKRGRMLVIGERTGHVLAYPADGGTPREWPAIAPQVRLAPGIVRVPGQENPPHDPASGLPFTWAADLALSPRGRLVFASERSSSTVSVTSADTGELLGWTRTEEQPRGIAVDPAGEFLLVTGELSGTVSLYRVTDDGRLSRTAQVAAPPGQVWAEAAELDPRAPGGSVTRS